MVSIFLVFGVLIIISAIEITFDKSFDFVFLGILIDSICLIKSSISDLRFVSFVFTTFGFKIFSNLDLTLSKSTLPTS